MKYIGSADEHIQFNGKFYGYAWFTNEEGIEIPVAYRVGRKNTLVTETVWKWIKKDRTKEQQSWIEANITKLQKLFK